MSPADQSLPDDRFAARLADYHEALAAGLAPAAEAPTADFSPELADRLHKAQSVLDQLEEDRLRTLSVPDGGLGAALARQDLPPALSGGERFGRFRVVRELGRGGYGVVFLAWDPRLRREVALKVPRPEALLTPDLRRRFLYEAQAAAGLDHPAVVPVYEVGEVGPSGTSPPATAPATAWPSGSANTTAPWPPAPRPAWSRRWPRAFTTPTAGACCTATSSRPTSCWTSPTARRPPGRTAIGRAGGGSRGWATSGWPGRWRGRPTRPARGRWSGPRRTWRPSRRPGGGTTSAWPRTSGPWA
jgi:hypothetical protein